MTPARQAGYRFPSVTIIMDFEPLLTPKKCLVNRLEEKRKKIADELQIRFPGEMSELVQAKLENIISNLNFSAPGKGLAIFVSPVFEKVYYLSTNQEERILVQESFKIRDLARNKSALRDYYILKLENGNGTLFFDRSVGRIAIENNALEQVDKVLSRELERSPLPLFVVGEKKVLEAFGRITKHNAYVLRYIPFANDEASLRDPGRLVEPLLAEWPRLQNEYFRKQISEAAKRESLITGMSNTWNYIMSGRKGVLLIDEAYLDKPFYLDYHFITEFLPETFSRFSCIRSPMDRLIEKMIENGGDARVLNSHGSRNFDQVAVIGH